MKEILSPSMMCCDIGNLGQEIKDLEEANVDIYHLDVMDGHFVPNLGLSLQEITYIVNKTSKLTDVHLMVLNPRDYIEKLCNIGVDIIYIHPEVENHPIRLLNEIREKGAMPGVAISPNISINMIVELLPYIDYMLIMTVSPGFSGQKYLKSVDKKIDSILELRNQYAFKIVLDGALSPEVIKSNLRKGIEGYVLGTSALFGKNKSYTEIINDLRR